MVNSKKGFHSTWLWKGPLWFFSWKETNGTLLMPFIFSEMTSCIRIILENRKLFSKAVRGR